MSTAANRSARNLLQATNQSAEQIEQLISSGSVRVLCIQGESGVGKTRLANTITADIVDNFPHNARVYLPPEGLLFTVEDLLLSSLLNQLLPVTPRGLRRESLLDELFEFIGSRKIFCLIDNAESLSKEWLSNFIVHWLNTDGESVLVITIPVAPVLRLRRQKSEDSYTVYTLSGISPADDHLILELLGRDLCSRFPRRELLSVADMVRNIPQLLLYLRWLNPSTLQTLSEVAIDLSRNTDLTDMVSHAILETNTTIVPFLALGRVRSIQFEEGLLASLWDRLGGGSVQGYVTARDRLLELGILSRAGDIPGAMQINPAVHVHLEKYVSRELAAGQLAQIEYHIGEYYKGKFLNEVPLLNSNWIEEFIYHSARARNIEAATRFMISGGWLEGLRRTGQALGVRRILTAARAELKTVALSDITPQVAESCETLLDIVDLEMSHVLSDLSEYEQALAILSKVAAGKTASAESEEAIRFREIIAFRRGICLGDSGELHGAALSYLGLVENCMLSGKITRTAVEALGYAAMVLGYLREQSARPLGALSVGLAEQVGNARLIVRNRCSYSQLLAYAGLAGEAVESLSQAETIIDSSAGHLDRRELGRVLVAKVSAYLAVGDLRNAHRTAETASSVNAQLGDRRRLARSQAFAGVIAFREGRLSEAREASATALDLFVRVGDILNALICCFNLACFDGMSPAQIIDMAAMQGEGYAGSWIGVFRGIATKKYTVNTIGGFWAADYCVSMLGLSPEAMEKTGILDT